MRFINIISYYPFLHEFLFAPIVNDIYIVDVLKYRYIFTLASISSHRLQITDPRCKLSSIFASQFAARNQTRSQIMDSGRGHYSHCPTIYYFLDQLLRPITFSEKLLAVKRTEKNKYRYLISNVYYGFSLLLLR